MGAAFAPNPINSDMKIISTFLILFLSTTLAYAQPAEFAFTATNISGVFTGQAQINGVFAAAEDWVAAFDSDGNCAGANPVIVNAGLSYINLTIYGDDPSTTSVDEGIDSGESFTIKIWDASENKIISYPNDSSPAEFTEWANNNGAPIPAYNDPNMVYNFEFSLPTITLDIGENMGLEGEIVSVPVILREYVGTLAALQGTLKFSTSEVADIQGISGNLISANNIQLNNANGQFSALVSDGLPTTGADTLFFVNLLLSGSPGDSTGIFMDDDPNIFTRLEITIFENGAIEIINAIQLIDGWVKILKDADLDGLIYFWGDFSPVNLVDVNLDFPDTPEDPDSTQTTGLPGTYLFDNVDVGKDVEIYCVKETNPVNGVSTGPLFLVQRYTVLGPGPVGQYNSPYQMVASDADCNEVINASDIIRIQQVIVRNPNVELCKSWAFVPEYYTNLPDFNMNSQGFVLAYPEAVSVNQIQSDTSLNFVGVKVGDILGFADQSSLIARTPPEELRSSASIKLRLVDRSVTSGEFFEVSLTSENFQNLGGLQMALEYAADKLEFHDFVGSSQAIQPQSYHDIETGSLRTSWIAPSVDGVSLSAETPILILRFKALNDANNLSDLLWINTNTMRAEATDINLKQYQLDLHWESLTSNVSIGRQAGYYLYQNFPNPAKEETRIKFSLPFAQRATLDLIDPLGRVVASYEQFFPQGFSEVYISTRRLHVGLYQYRLRTETYTEVKTMMTVR